MKIVTIIKRIECVVIRAENNEQARELHYLLNHYRIEHTMFAHQVVIANSMRLTPKQEGPQ